MELSPEIVAAGLAAFLRSAGLNVPRSAGAAHAAIARRACCAASRRSAPAARTAPPRKLPDGSFATAGIGCHFMALDDGDQTRTFTHMGGEGAPFVGMAPFTDTPHVFANIGDGTYTHSGIMAIRQAVAAEDAASPTSCCSTTRWR